MIRLYPLPPSPLWAFQSRWSPILTWACKCVPGMRPNPSQGWRWEGYPDACEIVVRLLKEKGVTVSVPDDFEEPGDWRNAPAPAIPLTELKLRPYQIDGVKFLVQKAEEGCLLADGMRLGKLQPIDEPVLTPSGWRPIGELKVGDDVVGLNGRPTRVTGVFPQGRQDTYRVTLTDGAWTRCGLDHLWHVRTPKDKYAGRPGSVKTLREIVAAGLCQPGTTNRRWFVPLPEPVIFNPSGPIPNLAPYTLGALIANGSLGRVVSHSGTPDQVEILARELPSDMRIARRSDNDIDLRPMTRGGPNLLRDALDFYGLTGKYSHEKFIPDAYLRASPSARLDLIRGLFDNDGTVSKDGMTVEYNTTSPQLAEDVLFLVRSLGGVAWMSTRIPTYEHNGEKKKGRLDHRIRVSLPNNITPFRLPRKAARYRPRTKFPPAHAIDRVDFEGQSECVCISVAAPDGLYVTRDCIVTHNTSQGLLAARCFSQKTLVVCPSNARGVWCRRPPEDNPKDLGGEIAKWWPEVLPALYEPEGVKNLPDTISPETRIVVIHYDILYAWVPLLLAWGFETLILDEAHMLTNYRSRRSGAVGDLAKRARYRIALTGTPLTNRPRDLHNLVSTICPARFGAFFIHPPLPGDKKQKMIGFAQRYCAAHLEEIGKGADKDAVWNFDGRSNEDELARRLSFFMLRRVKSEVDDQLPPKTRQIIPVPIPQKYMIRPTHEMFLRKADARRALDLSADGKLEHVIARVQGHLDEGDRVICFTYRRSFAEAVANGIVAAKHSRGYEAHVIHGGVTQKKRDALVVGLRKRTDPFVVCCTIDTCAVAIDLSFASTAVFGEITYEWLELAQAEDRLYKFGGEKTFIEYVIAKGTGDELVMEMVLKKLELSEKLIGKQGDRMLEDLRGKEEDGLRSLAERLRKQHERLKAGA